MLVDLDVTPVGLLVAICSFGIGPWRHVAPQSLTVAFGAKRTLVGRPPHRIMSSHPIGLTGVSSLTYLGDLAAIIASPQFVQKRSGLPIARITPAFKILPFWIVPEFLGKVEMFTLPSDRIMRIQIAV
jgi:hypothetical protein